MLGGGLDRGVIDEGLAGAPVQLKGEGAHALLVGFAQAGEADEERLALFDVHGNFLAQLEAVEKGRGGQRGDRAVVLAGFFQLGEDIGIHQIVEEVVVADIALQALGQLGLFLFQVDLGRFRAGASGGGLAVAQDDLLQRLGPTALGLAEATGEHVHHAGGEGGRAGVEIEHVTRLDALGEEENREVAHDLARRGDLDDVAKEEIDLAVVADDFGPALAQAQRGGLLAQVGVLAAGHLVAVNLGTAELGRAVEGAVVLAHGLPVDRELVERLLIELRVPRAGAQGVRDGVEVGLGGQAGEGGNGQVHDVGPGFGGLENAGAGDAAAVVRVEVDGDADFLLEGLDQLFGGERVAQTGHVLDREQVGAHLLEFLGQAHVVLQRILGPVGVEDIAGVADGGLAEGVGVLGNGLDGDFEVGQVVQAVKNAEEVDSGLGGVLDEFAHDVVGIVGVADAVGPAQEHLEEHIGDLLAQLAQAGVGALVQEAHRGVKGRAAPHFHTEEVGQATGHDRGDLEHVVAADAGGEQALVGVAEGGVGHQQALLFAHPLGEFGGSELLELLAGAVGRGGLMVPLGHDQRQVAIGLRAALDLRVAVDDDLPEVAQELGRAVAPGRETEQLRRGINERGGGPALDENGVGDDVFEEGDVGLDPTDAHLAQGAVHAVNRPLEGGVGGSELDQQGVVEGRDDRPGVAHGPVQPDTEPGGAAVVDDLAVVGRKVLLRVLRGDAALDGEAVAGDLVLSGQVDGGAVQGLALGDKDLRADDVETGDDLGHRVLDLHARIHLDEKPLLALLVVEKLDGPGIVVADALGQLDGGLAEAVAHLVGQADRGGDFNDLLVAALDGAVPLVQVQDVAVLVADDLHLDVLGLGDVALQKDLRVAKGDLGLVLGFLQQRDKLLRVADDAHAAPAAAMGGLDNQGEPDLLGGFHRLLGIADRVGCAGQGGDADFFRRAAGLDLVAHHLQQLGAGPDEGDAGVLTGSGEGRVFR